MNPEDKLSDAERKLYEAMSEISEDCWCAGWMIGNEYSLWAALHDGELKYGQSEIDREELAKVAALSVQTGCWIAWLDDDELPIAEHGPYAIPLHEWSAIYESKQARATPSPAPIQQTQQDSCIPPSRAEPASQQDEAVSAITDTASARRYVDEWHRKHFPTDRTFQRYIMADPPRSNPLAGDFAWQLAKALEQLEAGRCRAQGGDTKQPRHIPDSECVQGKCGYCTTGCWGVCGLRNPSWVIAPTVKASQ